MSEIGKTENRRAESRGTENRETENKIAEDIKIGIGDTVADGRTWQQLLDEGRQMLDSAGITEAELDAWYLLEAAFPVDRVHFLMDRNRAVYAGILQKGYPVYQECLQKRARRIPLQQILGTQDFMGLTFRVNEHVLIPRQDTETLVETVLREHPERESSVLDLCTGSGCIAISLAVLGRYRSVTASDLSLEALKTAKKNAAALFSVQKDVVRSQSSRLSERPWRQEMTVWTAESAAAGSRVFGSAAAGSHVFGSAAAGSHAGARPDEERLNTGRREADRPCMARRLLLVESNLYDGLREDAPFDVIVSNPPYIPSAVIEGLEPEVREHEPRMALDGREDGLYYYRRLADESRRFLRDGGGLYLEIGYDQAEAVTGFLAAAGYENIGVVRDAPGLDRVVKAVWRERA